MIKAVIVKISPFITESQDYQYVDRNKFLLATNSLDQKTIYTTISDRRRYIAYTTEEHKRILNADFVVYSPKNKEKYTIIECKSQTSTGSIDKKYLYLNENIKQKYPYKTIITLDMLILDTMATKKVQKLGLKSKKKPTPIYYKSFKIFLSSELGLLKI